MFFVNTLTRVEIWRNDWKFSRLVVRNKTSWNLCPCVCSFLFWILFWCVLYKLRHACKFKCRIVRIGAKHDNSLYCNRNWEKKFIMEKFLIFKNQVLGCVVCKWSVHINCIIIINVKITKNQTIIYFVFIY